MLTFLWRYLTDRKVACVCCGVARGYVAREGHMAWLCPACAVPTGDPGVGQCRPVPR